MKLSALIRQTIALWLTAMVMCMSFAVAAHDESHHDDELTPHCEVCCSAIQLSQVLHHATPSIVIVPQSFEPLEQQVYLTLLSSTTAYFGRAPPFNG
ncbi:hypothetical protein G3R49_11625 [Shewanella sp. WXL01]|uniref:hypothetical protein n=1 Tax=Shewanella sp. WXL01 TaxID=2709721 RepID=UPI0014382D54|nr:hypothetical protein [Shewanella sp. WXL01]NKF51203.1 hypothetical protein [Shewanella sp. WXL01]